VVVYSGRLDLSRIEPCLITLTQARLGSDIFPFLSLPELGIQWPRGDLEAAAGAEAGAPLSLEETSI
jgi:hypothetical protein